LNNINLPGDKFCRVLRDEGWESGVHIVREAGSASVVMVMAKLWELQMLNAVFAMEQVNAQLAMELAKCLSCFQTHVRARAKNACMQIRLKEFSDSAISRLQNCIIYFHNSIDGTSNQIVIENGGYTQGVGPWYDLGDSDTIYIVMTVEANSTGTSYVYVYLEVLIPNTTTSAQYIIVFEIT